MNNIKAIRKQKNISVTELAQRLGMSQSNLTKIENGQLELKQNIAQKIAQELQIAETSLYQKQIIDGYINLNIINPEMLSLPTLSTYPILNNKELNFTVGYEAYIMPDDTMCPSIRQNTITIIDKKVTKFTQNGIYLIKNNDLIELRRIQQINKDECRIITDNIAYPPQTTDISSLNIMGRAIGIHTYQSL